MHQDPIVIVSAKRTPQGNLLGSLSSLSANELGAIAIKEAVSNSSLKPEQIDEVLMGCVLPAGQGQAPARQATLKAGLLSSCPATTINKMCGSGMKAVMIGHDMLLAGNHQAIIAGGMESMSQAPYLLSKARQGYRLGHGELKDHMFIDGLEDAYDQGQLMGVFAERTAEHYQFSRQQQDDFAIQSLERAKKATDAGYFANELVTVTIKNKKGQHEVSVDEGILTARPEKIPQLKPAFAKNGSVTAANSSSISDGAAALILMRRSSAEKHDITPLATIIGHSGYAHEPSWFTTAPISAINNLLTRLDWTIADVDLFEINEAFAVVTLAAMHDLDIPHEKVNIHGGACVLGHPIGASGARIIVTLINALKQTNQRRGIASLCIGGGEATAVAIELCE